MKKVKYKNLKTGTFTLLPIVVFVLIIKWAINIICTISDTIFILIPNYDFTNASGNLLWYWHIAGILVLLLLILSVGWIMNHYYIGRKINDLIQPVIKKTPVLNTLTRIGKQMNEISQKKSSFKEVVFIEFPAPGIYYIGFITSEGSKSLDKILKKKVVSVFMPTTPNPTNGFLCAVSVKKITRTKIPIEKGFEYVISMGTLIDFEAIEKIMTTPSV